MPIALKQENDGRILAVHVNGKLHVDDYAAFVPTFELLIEQHGKVRLLFDMSHFHGWDAGAAWHDFKLGFHHYSDIERLAMVGEEKWQYGLAAFIEPFTHATVRYFDHGQMSQARQWLRAD